MPTHEFPMVNPGVDNSPDFHAGPNALPATQQGRIIRVVSESAPNITVEYDVADLDERHLEYLKRAVKNKALFNDTTWAAKTTEQKLSHLRTCLQNVACLLLDVLKSDMES